MHLWPAAGQIQSQPSIYCISKPFVCLLGLSNCLGGSWLSLCSLWLGDSTKIHLTTHMPTLVLWQWHPLLCFLCTAHADAAFMALQHCCASNNVSEGRKTCRQLGRAMVVSPSLTTGDFSWAFHIQLSPTLLRQAILYKEIMSHWSFLSSSPSQCGCVTAPLSSILVIYAPKPGLGQYSWGNRWLQPPGTQWPPPGCAQHSLNFSLVKQDSGANRQVLK